MWEVQRELRDPGLVPRLANWVEGCTRSGMEVSINLEENVANEFNRNPVPEKLKLKKA